MTERLANPSCDVVRRLSITRMLYHRIAPYASDTMTVLVNTGSTLMQAADDEERVVGQRTWGPKGQGHEQAPTVHVYIHIYSQAGKWTSDIAKPHVSVNSNNSSIDYQKTATGNENLQPEPESNEYSSSKKTTRIYSSSSKLLE